MSLGHILPKEHGTWAYWLAPFAVGCGVARHFGAREAVLLAALLAAFLAYGQLAQWVRLRRAPRPDAAALRLAGRSALGLTLVAALLAAVLALWTGLVGLLGFAVIGAAAATAGLLLVRERVERGLAGQLAAPLGLAASAAAAHYVSRGTLEAQAVALWAFSALFFLGGVLYVRLKIGAIPKRDALRSPAARIALAAPTLLMEVGVVIASAVVIHLGALSLWALAAFVPTAVQIVVGTLRLHRPAVLKRVGIISTIHAALFVILVSALA